jgi:uncharacterized protein YuzE
MKFFFDEQTGTYALVLSEAKIIDSELKKNLVINYGADGQVIGLEILPFDAEGLALKNTEAQKNILNQALHAG